MLGKRHDEIRVFQVSPEGHPVCIGFVMRQNVMSCENKRRAPVSARAVKQPHEDSPPVLERNPLHVYYVVPAGGNMAQEAPEIQAELDRAASKP